LFLLLQHEWPVKGHPSTPFVIASAALWRSIPGTSSPAAAQLREPVLLLAAMGDVGLTGKRSPGLVLHWSAVGAEGAASVLERPDAAANGQVAVASLPEGWSTLPDMSWDAGAKKSRGWRVCCGCRVGIDWQLTNYLCMCRALHA
jgi:hypothetical protein